MLPRRKRALAISLGPVATHLWSSYLSPTSQCYDCDLPPTLTHSSPSPLELTSPPPSKQQATSPRWTQPPARRAQCRASFAPPAARETARTRARATSTEGRGGVKRRWREPRVANERVAQMHTLELAPHRPLFSYNPFPINNSFSPPHHARPPAQASQARPAPDQDVRVRRPAASADPSRPAATQRARKCPKTSLTQAICCGMCNVRGCEHARQEQLEH
jgi:hypothetical protein